MAINSLGTVYERRDIQVLIQRSSDGGATVRIHGAEVIEAQIEKRAIDRWARKPNALFPIADALDLTYATPLWRTWIMSTSTPSTQVSATLRRLTLNVTDTRLAGLAWERSFYEFFYSQNDSPTIVRTSPVRPRIFSSYLTLPIRILHLSPQSNSLVVDAVRRVFGWHSDLPTVAQAVVAQSTPLELAASWRQQMDWGAATIIHLDPYPLLDQPELLLSTTDPDRPGTLGWLRRMTDTWQTRLLVIQCRSAQLPALRRLGAALADRSGPAVLVGVLPIEAIRSLYAGLIHDQPLDAIFDYLFRICRQKASLFVGMGRSEALRVSAIAEQLIDFAKYTLDPFERLTTRDEQDIRYLVARQQPQLLFYETEDIVGGRSEHPYAIEQGRIWFDTQLRILGDNLTSRTISGTQLPQGALLFDFHEGEGLLPLAQELVSFRNQVGIIPTAAKPYIFAPSTVPTTERFVNMCLAQSKLDRTVAPLPQRIEQVGHPFLHLGDPYLLGIQIGQRNQDIFIAGITAMVEEKIKWEDGMAGVWLEIGVTGIDFTVQGSGVQEVWLPQNGETEWIYFSVVPTRPEVSQLRFSIYYKNDVLQSFRLAALTTHAEPGTAGDEGGRTASTLEGRAQALAEALQTSAQETFGLVYLARLEYAVTSQLETGPQRSERRISIVANEIDGRAGITIKGPNIFSPITVHSNIDEKVKAMRDTLERVAVDQGTMALSPRYEFGNSNSGLPQNLEADLKDLATLGWDLYYSIVDSDERNKLTKVLEAGEVLIHVAEIVVEKALPWALVYDRPYNPHLGDYEQLVCLVALPNGQGDLPVTRCGEHENCPLHKTQLDQRSKTGQKPVIEETVVCPLHFWGFGHVIELPPQQTPAGKTQEQIRCIRVPAAQSTIHIAASFNNSLGRTKEHTAKLKSIVAQSAYKPAEIYDKYTYEDILKELKERDDLDLIYFFCHAKPDTGARAYLEFADKKPAYDANFAQGKEWLSNPLVFLNGCNTTGFSPKALTPFIGAFVRDRKAAGLIGTEIAVFTRLAAEVAELFIQDMLMGKRAGEALLRIRRKLLHQYNPLGLVYTLYAAADLALDLDGDGKCP